MTKKLYVGNLSYATTEGNLSELFGALGEVTSVSLITDRMSGRSKGFAFVEMAEEHSEREKRLADPNVSLSLEARRAKAARGELIISVPIGYEKEHQRMVKTPNLRIQQAIEHVFAKFLELGTARQVLGWFLDQGMALPVRVAGHGTRGAAPGQGRDPAPRLRPPLPGSPAYRR